MPRIPAPAGFVDAGVLNGGKLEGLADVPPEYEILGTYLPTNALAEIVNKGSTSLSPFCRAIFARQFPTVAAADEAFTRSVKDMKQAETQPLHTEIPMGDWIAGGNAKARGAFQATDSVHAICVTTTSRSSKSESKEQYAFVHSSAILRLHDQILMVGATYPMFGEKDVETCKITTVEWIKEIQRLNP
jgi:hypothetical protein